MMIADVTTLASSPTASILSYRGRPGLAYSVMRDARAIRHGSILGGWPRPFPPTVESIRCLMPALALSGLRLSITAEMPRARLAEGSFEGGARSRYGPCVQFSHWCHAASSPAEHA